MPKITYINSTGESATIDVPVGWSVMEGAIQNDVAGIVAECGGGCACATCHVFVDKEWLERIGDSLCYDWIIVIQGIPQWFDRITIATWQFIN